MMLVQYLIPFHFFVVMIFSAPLFTTISEEITLPTTITPAASENINLPNILLPDPSEKTINYETRGGHFEGDMVFHGGFDPSKPTSRAVAIYGPHRWPNNVIPYDISAIKSSDQGIIVNAMNTLMYAVGTPVQGQTSRRSCVYFRPKLSNENNFVKIVYGTGCSGTVGYWPNDAMTLTLDRSGCFGSGTIQHELTHLLGFYHEQSRPDRDTFITVNYKNIESSEVYNFNQYVWGSTVLNQNTAYDYGSIMHYNAYAFSANGQATILQKKSGVTIGQRVQLSATDIAEVRAYYNC